MIKTLDKTGREGIYLNIIKDMYDKSTANIILNGEKLKAFLLRSGTRQGYPFLPLLFNSFGGSSYGNQRRKRNKRNPDQKIRNIILLFADSMLLYIENPVLSNN